MLLEQDVGLVVGDPRALGSELLLEQLHVDQPELGQPDLDRGHAVLDLLPDLVDGDVVPVDAHHHVGGNVVTPLDVGRLVQIGDELVHHDLIEHPLGHLVAVARLGCGSAFVVGGSQVL